MSIARRVSSALLLAGVAALAACTRAAHDTPGPSPETAAAAVTAQETATAGGAGPAIVPYPVSIGREVYRRYCLTCHGDSGAGDGFNAFNLDPRPRDFSDPAFLKKTDAEVRDAIRRGGAGVGLSPLMPPWGRTLNDRQIDDLILYLKTLRPKAS